MEHDNIELNESRKKAPFFSWNGAFLIIQFENIPG